MFRKSMFRSIIIMIVALVFASTAYALAASNTMADGGKAGDGDGGVSGYDVSGVTYTLNGALIAAVDFDLDDVASDVQASLSDAPFTTEIWATLCTNTSGNHWSCTFPAGTTALDAASLRVVAAQ